MLNNIYSYFESFDYKFIDYKSFDYKSIDLCKYFSSISDCLSKNPIQEYNNITTSKKTDEVEENNFKQLVYSQELEEFILI